MSTVPRDIALPNRQLPHRTFETRPVASTFGRSYIGPVRSQARGVLSETPVSHVERLIERVRAPGVGLKHDPEKSNPVFGRDHEQKLTAGRRRGR